MVTPTSGPHPLRERLARGAALLFSGSLAALLIAQAGMPGCSASTASEAPPPAPPAAASDASQRPPTQPVRVTEPALAPTPNHPAPPAADPAATPAANGPSGGAPPPYFPATKSGDWLPPPRPEPQTQGRGQARPQKGSSW